MVGFGWVGITLRSSLDLNGTFGARHSEREGRDSVILLVRKCETGKTENLTDRSGRADRMSKVVWTLRDFV